MRVRRIRLAPLFLHTLTTQSRFSYLAKGVLNPSNLVPEGRALFVHMHWLHALDRLESSGIRCIEERLDSVATNDEPRRVGWDKYLMVRSRRYMSLESLRVASTRYLPAFGLYSAATPAKSCLL